MCVCVCVCVIFKQEEQTGCHPRYKGCSKNSWCFSADRPSTTISYTIAAKELDEIEDVFKYELCSYMYPPALFDSSLLVLHVDGGSLLQRHTMDTGDHLQGDSSMYSRECDVKVW